MSTPITTLCSQLKEFFQIEFKNRIQTFLNFLCLRKGLSSLFKITALIYFIKLSHDNPSFCQLLKENIFFPRIHPLLNPFFQIGLYKVKVFVGHCSWSFGYCCGSYCRKQSSSSTSFNWQVKSTFRRPFREQMDTNCFWPKSIFLMNEFKVSPCYGR